jgi:hypothetical protein
VGGLVAAAALVGAAFFVASRGPAGPAHLQAVAGQVRVRRGDASFAGRSGAALLFGDWLEVGPRSSADVKYDGESTRISLGAGTRLRLDGAGGGKHCDLKSGAIRVEVAPQPAGAPMVLVTPHARVEVLGTSFRLVAGSEGTRLEVREGRVRMIVPGSGDAVEVAAGMSATAQPGRGLLSVRTGGAAPETKPAGVKKQHTAKLLREFKLGTEHGFKEGGVAGDRAMAFDGSHLFYAGNGGLYRIDPKMGVVLKSSRVFHKTAGIVWDGKRLWILCEELSQGQRRTLVRQIDRDTLRPKGGSGIPLPGGDAARGKAGPERCLVAGARGPLLVGRHKAFLLVPETRSWERLSPEDASRAGAGASASRRSLGTCCHWGGRRWSISCGMWPPEGGRLLGVAGSGAGQRGRVEVALPLAGGRPVVPVAIAAGGDGRFWVAVRGKAGFGFYLFDAGVIALGADPGSGEQSGEADKVENGKAEQERQKEQGAEKKKE